MQGVVEDNIAVHEAVSERGAVKDEQLSRELSQTKTDGGNEFPSIPLGHSLGLIQRVDRLDHTLSELEAAEAARSGCLSSSTVSDRHAVSCPPTPLSFRKHCKPAESILIEVKQKGTLVERVSQLEERVSTVGESLQLVERVSQLEERVCTLGESLQVACSRKYSEFDAQSGSAFSCHPNEAEGYQHPSPPDIPAVEKHEVSPSKYDVSPKTEEPALNFGSGFGALESETGYRQEPPERRHEATEQKKPKQENDKNGERLLSPFDNVDNGTQSRPSFEKTGGLRRWISRSFKRVGFGVHKTGKDNTSHTSKHRWNSGEQFTCK